MTMEPPKEYREAEFERIQTLMRGHRYASLFFAAHDLGLLQILSVQAMRPAELAEKYNLSMRGLLPLLTALKSLGLVENQGENVGVPCGLASFFDEESADYLGSLIEHEKHFVDRWSRLAESVKSGRPVKNTRQKRSAADAGRFIKAMATMGEKSAALVLQKIAFKGDEHVLDLGGGPGVYQRIFCEQQPGITYTLFEQPETIAVAEKSLEGHPAGSRMRFIAGDMISDDIGTGYEIILLSNVIHIYGEKTVFAVIQKCHRALKANGRLLIKDFFLYPEQNGPEFSALFSLHMLLSTDEGRCYNEKEVIRMMVNSGFVATKRLDITDKSVILEGVRA